MAMNLAKAKEAIRNELNSPTFDADSVGKIEGIIAELEAARIKWKEDPEIANLHERYIAAFAKLDETVRKDLASQISAARSRQEALKAEVTGIEIPAVVLGNKELMRQLQALGIVRGDRAVFENTDVAEKIGKYLGYLNFISDAERDGRHAIKDMKTLVDNYLDITNEGTDWILDKRFLQYKYIEAIYNDIIRRGYVLEKHGTTGEYRIVCPKVKTDPSGKQYIVRENLDAKHPNHEYLRILKGPNTRNAIDVAIVSSIMSKDFALDSHEVVGQKTMIVHLLQKHGIKSRSGKNIQKAELMLLDWKGTVLEQVDEKLLAVTKPDDEVSVQSYQELLYLKNFIEREEYMQTDYNRRIFAEANIYRKGFIQEKALIDAYGGGSLDGLDDKSMGDIIQQLGKEARGPLVIFGILAWLMGFKKFAMGALGVGILGPSVGKMINSVSDAGADALFSDDELELIMPHEVVPILDNEDYQKQFEKIADLNSKNLKELVDDKGRTLPYVGNNFIIAKIINELGSSDALNELNLNDPNVATEAFRKLGSVQVTNTDFPNYHGAPYTITQADVEQFINLVKASSVAEADDNTLSDVLLEGNDIRNQNYESFDFIIDNNFDKALNDHLRARWNVNTGVAGRETLKGLQATIEETLKAGKIDTLTDAIKKRKAADVFSSLPDRLSDIDDLIAEIQAMTVAAGVTPGPNQISGATANPLISTLRKYKNFLEIDAEMSRYDGFMASGKSFVADKWGDFATFTGGLIGRTGISELQAEKDEIDAIIVKITPTTFVVNGRTINITTDPLNASIVERANAVKADLEARSNALQAEIDRRNEDLRRRAFGIPSIAAIDNLALDEGDSAYRDAVVEIKNAADAFKDAVTEFERTGDINAAFSNANLDRYILLNAANDTLTGMSLTGTPTFPNKLWLRVEVQKLFGPGKAMEKFKTKAQNSFNNYFAGNKNIENTINGLTDTFTAASPFTIDGFIDSIEKIEDQSDLLAGKIGIVRTAWADIMTGTDTTQVERAYKTAQIDAIFGPTFAATDEDKTAKAVIESIAAKREKIEDGFQTYINGITVSGAYATDVVTLRELLQIERRGVLDKISDAQTKTDYANKLEEISGAIIGAVPSDPTGITQLIDIEDILGFSVPSGAYQIAIKAVLGSSALETKFNQKVQAVGSTMLDSYTASPSPYADDMARLRAIVAFKASGNYHWIESRISGFEGQYEAKLQVIRENAQRSTLVTFDAGLISTIGSVTAGFPSGDARLVLEDYEAGSTKTLSELIALLGLENSAPTGDFGPQNFTQSDRNSIYNKLKSLNILG